MNKHIPLIFCWFVNLLIILVVNYLLPKNVVLGNGWLNGIYAAFWMGILITALDHLAKHINKMRLHLKGRTNLFIYYAVCNILIFWLLARLPQLTGYGISVFYLAILLGVLTTIAQWLVRQNLKKYRII